MKIRSRIVGCACLVISSCFGYSIKKPKAFSRRDLLQHVAIAAVLCSARPAIAVTPTGPNDGKLPDLPPEAVRSYLQYRVPLQTSADFYLFELKPKLADTAEWGDVADLFQVNSANGLGIPSRIEREFTNTFRILGLSMPPDTAEEMRDAQNKFDQAMATVAKTTGGYRRDLPVEISQSAVDSAILAWDQGRQAINEFFTTLNDATGLNEMKTIPPNGPNQIAAYGRSEQRYVALKKKIKLCQNRGGPTLSQAWGQLMVSGYMQDSCGIPNLDEYFYQS